MPVYDYSTTGNEVKIKRPSTSSGLEFNERLTTKIEDLYSLAVRVLLLIIPVFIANCSHNVLPSNLSMQSKDWLKDPLKLYDFFRESLQKGQYYHAYMCISPQFQKIINYETFYMTLSASHTLRRLLTTSEVHKIGHNKTNHATILLCNESFGMSEPINIIKLDIGIWVFDVTQERFNELGKMLNEWWALQIEDAQGQRFAYPPDWIYKPIKSCMCDALRCPASWWRRERHSHHGATGAHEDLR